MVNKKVTIKEAEEYLKKNGDFITQWPFTFECLTVGLVEDSWKELKKDKVSFLKAEYR